MAYTNCFLQRIFAEYRQPFALTYLGVSLMVIYLPISLLKDRICSLWDRNTFRNIFSDRSVASTTTELNIALRNNELNQSSEIDLRTNLITDKDLSESEEGWPLISKSEEDERQVLEHGGELNSWEIVKCSLYLTPIWFLTEVHSTSSSVPFKSLVYICIFYTSWCFWTPLGKMIFHLALS